MVKEKEAKTKKELDLFLRKVTKVVNPVIQELLYSYMDRKFRPLVNYPVSTKGKRLRPALTLVSCQLLGGKITDALYPAAGLEILHNYTLIVDDIIDNSILRRERPTTWAKFGKSIAECIGIDYSAVIFQAANRSKKPIMVSELFAKTIKAIVEGEILDILFEQSGREDEPYIVKNRYTRVSERDYYKMAGQKTAVLFQTCSEVGGICAEANKKQLEALKNYGFNLGIAFQIRDDILDIFGQEKKFGKKIGKDIEERKLGNIVILFALKELPQKEKERILDILGKKRITNKDIREAIKLINRTNSYQRAYQLGERFIEKAKQNLRFLPKNKWNNILKNLADFVIQREK